jgi:hypothetical protein
LDEAISRKTFVPLVLRAGNVDGENSVSLPGSNKLAGRGSDCFLFADKPEAEQRASDLFVSHLR